MKKLLGIVVLGLLLCTNVSSDEKFKGFLKCDKMFIVYIDEENKFAEIDGKKYKLYSTSTQFEILREDKLLKTKEALFINRLIGLASYDKYQLQFDNSWIVTPKNGYCKKIDRKF